MNPFDKQTNKPTPTNNATISTDGHVCFHINQYALNDNEREKKKWEKKRKKKKNCICIWMSVSSVCVWVEDQCFSISYSVTLGSGSQDLWG